MNKFLKLSIIFTSIGILLVICLFFLNSCAPSHYHKIYHIEDLTIHFADHDTIQKEYFKLRPSPYNDTIVGFYNPWTNEIWCEWDDEDTCYHELKHALGFMHDEYGNWYKDKP